MAERTRCGYITAQNAVMRAPMEYPMTSAVAMPRWSSSASTSPAIRSV